MLRALLLRDPRLLLPVIEPEPCALAAAADVVISVVANPHKTFPTQLRVRREWNPVRQHVRTWRLVGAVGHARMMHSSREMHRWAVGWCEASTLSSIQIHFMPK